jgi:hypothetical protein
MAKGCETYRPSRRMLVLAVRSPHMGQHVTRLVRFARYRLQVQMVEL